MELFEILQVLQERKFYLKSLGLPVIPAALISDYASLLPDAVQPLGVALAYEREGWKREICCKVLQSTRLPEVCAQMVQTYLKFKSQTMPNKYPRRVSLCVVVSHRPKEPPIQRRGEGKEKVPGRRKRLTREVREVRKVLGFPLWHPFNPETRNFERPSVNRWKQLRTELRAKRVCPAPLWPFQFRKESLRAYVLLPDGIVCVALFAFTYTGARISVKFQLALWNPADQSDTGRNIGSNIKILDHINCWNLCYDAFSDRLFLCVAVAILPESLCLVTYTADEFSKQPERLSLPQSCISWSRQTQTIRLGIRTFEDRKFCLLATPQEVFLFTYDCSVFRWRQLECERDLSETETWGWELVIPGLYLDWLEKEYGLRKPKPRRADLIRGGCGDRIYSQTFPA